MAWVKIPVENHPLFLAALPKDPRVSTLKMFGAVAALVNGNMFGGLFGHSMMVKLSPADQADAMKLDGSEPFDPMGNGRVMSNTVLLSASVMDDPAEMRSWLARALSYAATLPPKKKTKKVKAPAKNATAPAKRATAPARKAPAKKATARAKKSAAVARPKAAARAPASRRPRAATRAKRK